MANVSRETEAKMDIYVSTLLKWQRSINLIGRGTVDDIWERHIADSWQLAKLIKPDQQVVDLGSGAGFPGLVIACLQEGQRTATTFLIESNAKKCAFLREAAREMGIAETGKVAILCERVEVVLPSMTDIDIVTARAFAGLSDLLAHCLRLPTQPTKALFPKGRSYETEVELAREGFTFDLNVLPSNVEHDSFLLELWNIRKKVGE